MKNRHLIQAYHDAIREFVNEVVAPPYREDVSLRRASELARRISDSADALDYFYNAAASEEPCSEAVDP
jgi:hypothetical protein